MLGELAVNESLPGFHVVTQCTTLPPAAPSTCTLLSCLAVCWHCDQCLPELLRILRASSTCLQAVQLTAAADCAPRHSCRRSPRLLRYTHHTCVLQNGGQPTFVVRAQFARYALTQPVAVLDGGRFNTTEIHCTEYFSGTLGCEPLLLCAALLAQCLKLLQHLPSVSLL